MVHVALFWEVSPKPTLISGVSLTDDFHYCGIDLLSSGLDIRLTFHWQSHTAAPQTAYVQSYLFSASLHRTFGLKVTSDPAKSIQSVKTKDCENNAKSFPSL